MRRRYRLKARMLRLLLVATGMTGKMLTQIPL
jgi:hypothetical protein